MLFIQDLNFTEGVYLQERLLARCTDCSQGGGAYAFATADGIRLFMEDPSFKEFMKEGSYTLVIGTDSITNEISLDALNDLSNKYGDHFTIHAYVNSNPKVTFHPKYSWFRYADGGALVLGSGNLTEGGLRRNCEAFTDTAFDSAQLEMLMATWDLWLNQSSSFLHPLTDPLVIEQVRQNVTMNRFQVSEGGGERTLWEIPDEARVLVAEVPGKNNNRWSQANFTKAIFEDFFGAKAGTTSSNAFRLLLREVDADGQLGEAEIRPAVSVRSQNYRIEFNGLKGIPYPEESRPILVVAEVSRRNFLYSLIMPADHLYNTISTYLEEMYSGSEDQRKRIIVGVSDMRATVPALSLWQYA